MSGRQMPRKHSATLKVVGVALSALFTASCTGSDAATLPASPPIITIVMREYSFETRGGPLFAGRVVIDLENAGTVDHQLAVVKLAQDVPPLAEQLRGNTRRGAPGITTLIRKPGHKTTLGLDLEPGRYGLLCFMRDAEGVQHAFKGMNAELFVR